MYGCKMPENDREDDSDSEGAWSFKARPADIEWDSDLIGLWVAVGASGKQGAADLEDASGVEITPQAVREAFPDDVAACEAAWPAFVAHMKAEVGLELTEAPKFWLAGTEVS